MSTQSSRSWLIAVSYAVIALSVAPSVLFAHPRLKRSAPSAGDRLNVSPSQLRLWFTEAPELAMTTIELTDSAGRRILLDSVERDTDAVAVHANIVRSLGAGRYTVTWRTAASDGHLTRGSFSFNVLASAAAIGPTDRLKGVAPPNFQPATSSMDSASLEPTIDTALQPSSVAVRAVTFVCLLVIIGIVVFRFSVLDRGVRTGDLRALVSNRAATLGTIASVLLVLCAAARLVLQTSIVNGASTAHMSAAEIVADTQWGRIWLLQIVAAAIAAVAFVWAHRSARGWFAAAVAATVLAITPALGGHAAASFRFTTLGVLADSLHIVGAAGWLGSLLVLVTVGIPIVTRDEKEERWQVVASLVNAFSPTALAFAAIVALTGFVAAWLRVGTFAALWSSSYGQTLLLKLAVLLPLAGTGAYNWRRIRPALGTEGATGTLRRTATIELVVALVVIGITSVLVATEPPAG